uniref:SWIM-type domain-containing protein n=1 Tax=Cacopsylla melanoneura TaxID=428564 RepID=A0A8D8YQP4_9HEMI
MIKFCKNVKADGSLKKEILHLLPEDVNGLIVKVQQESTSFFSFTLRLEISTKEDALAWIKQFEDTTLTSFKVNNTFPENTQKIIFKKNFHCQHNTRPKSCVLRPHEKHTKCRARLNIVIKPQMKRSQDPYLEDYPCEVNINWCHNHIIDYEGLKYRRSDELWSIFAGYYANGHSPISALELHKIKLQTEHGQDFYKVAADGARCPNKIWCYKLYYKIFHKTCRDLSSEDTVNALEKYIKDYNDKCGDTCATMSRDTTTSDVVVSICSPLSKRVLTLKSVRELMFVISSSSASAGNRTNSSCILGTNSSATNQQAGNRNKSSLGNSKSTKANSRSTTNRSGSVNTSSLGGGQNSAGNTLLTSTKYLVLEAQNGDSIDNSTNQRLGNNTIANHSIGNTMSTNYNFGNDRSANHHNLGNDVSTNYNFGNDISDIYNLGKISSGNLHQHSLVVQTSSCLGNALTTPPNTLTIPANKVTNIFRSTGTTNIPTDNSNYLLENSNHSLEARNRNPAGNTLTLNNHSIGNITSLRTYKNTALKGQNLGNLEHLTTNSDQNSDKMEHLNSSGNVGPTAANQNTVLNHSYEGRNLDNNFDHLSTNPNRNSGNLGQFPTPPNRSSKRSTAGGGTGNKLSCRVTFLLSPSIAGALPLGIIVTTSDREVLITKGIEMVKEMLHDPEFSPQMIISDDSESERNSLIKMFPLSAVLLCKTHVLQTMWRYLSDPKNNLLEHKLTIFSLFTSLLHSKTKQSFDDQWVQLLCLESVCSNANLKFYLDCLKQREMEWALYARQGMLVRNKYTYGNSEVSIRLLKEQILHRTKSFNILQLVDTLTSALTGYYETRLLNCVHNRAQSWESKFYMPAERIQGLECSQYSDTEYIVRHPKGEEYLVNHEIGACTCAASMDGTLCKHQYAVLVNFSLPSESFVTSKDVLAKKHLYYIATGEQLLEEKVKWSGTELLHPKVEALNPKTTGLSKTLNPKTELSKTLNPKTTVGLLKPKTKFSNINTCRMLKSKEEICEEEGEEYEMENVIEEKEKRGIKTRKTVKKLERTTVKKTKMHMIEDCNDEEGDNENCRTSNTNSKRSKRGAKKKERCKVEIEDDDRSNESSRTNETNQPRFKVDRSSKGTYDENSCDDIEDRRSKKYTKTRQCNSRFKRKKKHVEKESDTENEDCDEKQQIENTGKSKRKVLLKGTVGNLNSERNGLKILKRDIRTVDVDTNRLDITHTKQTASQNEEAIDEIIENEIETDLEQNIEDIENAESEKYLEHLIATESDVDSDNDEHIEYIHCNGEDYFEDDIHSTVGDSGDCNEFNNKESNLNSRHHRRKVKDSQKKDMKVDSDDYSEHDHEDNADDGDINSHDSEDEKSLDENDFLSQDYRIMLGDVYTQTISASKRDADIEKELIHEELKDMVSVVPAGINDENEDLEELKDQLKSTEREKEALLVRLQNMFRITGEKLIYSYDLYKPAIEAMVSAFEGIKYDTGVLAAFHAFGKVNAHSGIKKSEISTASMNKSNVNSAAGTNTNVFHSISAAGDKRNVVEDRKRVVVMKNKAVVDTVWTSPNTRGHFLELGEQESNTHVTGEDIDPLSEQESNTHVTAESIDPSGITRYGIEDNMVTTGNNKRVIDGIEHTGDVKRYAIIDNTSTIGYKRHAIGVIDDSIGYKRHAIGLIDDNIGNKRHAIGVIDDSIGNKTHGLLENDVVPPGEVLVTYNIAQTVDGTYAYIDEGLYNIVVDGNSELQVECEAIAMDSMDTDAIQEGEHSMLR